MSLLVTVVFGDVMEVVTADDNSARHLGGDNTSCEDATADGNLTGKRTFLVDISSVYRFGGCLESKAHILIPTLLLRRYLLSTTSLRILEESLLLKCLFNLFSHGDSIQRVEGVPKTRVARRILYADNSQIGNLILSHTKTNYIAGRDLPYRHFRSKLNIRL